LCSTPPACFMERLQTLARVALEFMSQMRCVVATALGRRVLRPITDSASTQRGGYKICEKR
jgi:hypothetical protein